MKLKKKTYKKIEENKSDFQKKHLAKNTKFKKKKKKLSKKMQVKSG